jgi:hypothetical protein
MIGGSPSEEDFDLARAGLVEVWAGDYRWVERRAISPDEVAALDKASKSVERRSSLNNQLMIVVPFAAHWLLEAAGHKHRGGDLPSFLVIASGFLGGLSILLINGAKQQRIAKRKEEELDVFRALSGGEELLVGAKTPIRFNAARPGEMVSVHPICLAPRIAAGSRRLSDEEVEEVIQRPRPSFLGVWPLALVLVSLVVGGMTELVLQPWFVVAALFLVAVVGRFSVYPYWVELGFWRRVRTAFQVELREVGGQSMEVISGSEIPWTVDGVPAKWRRAAARDWLGDRTPKSGIHKSPVGA